MLFCQDLEHRDVLRPGPEPPHGNRVPADIAQAVGFPEHSPGARSATEAPNRGGHAAAPGTSPISPGGPRGDGNGAPPRSRRPTAEVDIPGLSKPGGDTFLVPSSCNSICQNYSDLLMGGDQVLPLSGSACEGRAQGSPQLPGRPFLQSSEFPPPMESLPQGSPHSSRKPRHGDSSHWRAGSGKDHSFLFQGGRPLSNSQLNAYLEQKLLDLYRQYMLESLVRQGSPSSVLASQLILTNVDHITQQLSREQNLEATKAKDMVISCLLRVASDLSASGEISTPQLQISDDQP